MIPGIQLSSFSPFLTTQDSLEMTFEKICSIGCHTLQLQGISCTIPPRKIAAALASHHLNSVSVQDFSSTVLSDPDSWISMCLETQSPWLCLSRIPGEKTEKSMEDFAHNLEALQKRLPEGLNLCFHPVRDDYAAVRRTDLVTLLMQRLPWLSLCLDLYHASVRGMPIPIFLSAFSGRICMVHFKDYVTRSDGSRILVPAGSGEIGYASLVRLCKDIPYGFVEQETWINDPFADLAEAYHWLCCETSPSGSSA